MDLYQLDCFRTVARMEHISNAAIVLHVTQPALSKIISRVEEYAGAPLFDRARNLILIDGGAQVVPGGALNALVIARGGYEVVQEPV